MIYNQIFLYKLVYMDYKHKYLKYKAKYLALKNQQEGGVFFSGTISIHLKNGMIITKS